MSTINDDIGASLPHPIDKRTIPILKNHHRLDLAFRENGNEQISFLDGIDAITEAISPLVGLREILSPISKPGTESDAYLRVISAVLRDLDYVIHKWKKSEIST